MRQRFRQVEWNMATKKRRDIAQKLMDSLLEEKGEFKRASSSEPEPPEISLAAETPAIPAPLSAPDATVPLSVERATAPPISPLPVQPPPYPQETHQGAHPNPLLAPNLVQAENLRIAQERILELENEVARLRKDGAHLAGAAEAVKRSLEETRAALEHSRIQGVEERRNLEEELNVYRASSSARDNENKELRQKVQELSVGLENDLKRVRVRERELEHRLELMRLENTAVVRSKDEIILDLKRRIDQLGMEAESYRDRLQGLHQNLEEKNDTLRQVVRALRLALASLEGSDDGVVAAPLNLRKVD